MRYSAAPLAVLLLLAACGSDNPAVPNAVPVTGHWTGTTTGAAGTFTFALDLKESGQDVTGTGTVAAASSTVPVTVTGTHVLTSLGLRLAAPGYVDVTYSSTLNARADSAAGTLVGSSLDALTLSIVRR
jgi:hypothetical protein